MLLSLFTNDLLVLRMKFKSIGGSVLGSIRFYLLPHPLKHRELSMLQMPKNSIIQLNREPPNCFSLKGWFLIQSYWNRHFTPNLDLWVTKYHKNTNTHISWLQWIGLRNFETVNCVVKALDREEAAICIFHLQQKGILQLNTCYINITSAMLTAEINRLNSTIYQHPNFSESCALPANAGVGLKREWQNHKFKELFKTNAVDVLPLNITGLTFHIRKI